MTDAALQTSITKFVAVFHGYICNVSSLDLGPEGRRYRKILYFSILEALAKARYRKRRPACAVSSFVVQYCSWPEGDNISLPHLVAALERTQEAAFDQLRNWAYQELKKWGSGGPGPLDRDPDKVTIQQRWPRAKDGTALKIPELDLDWPDLQHRNLLYAYRSKLSHETREPSMSFEDGTELEPFYESIGSQAGTEWHLVYPSAFLAASCRTGIESLKSWLLRESKDPYLQFEFGHYLIEKLNSPGYAIHRPFA